MTAKKRTANRARHQWKLAMMLLVAATTGTATADDTSQTRPASESGKGNPEVGRVLFNQGFPAVHGNGRTCADCHVPEEAFQLTPQHVEKRFQELQQRRLTDPRADDPLFRSIDANDGASDFTNLRQHGLVRVTIPLPVDANGQKLVWPVDDPEATVVGLWRSVPSVINTAFTAPYQQDGREATLQSQALGALVVHSEITSPPRPRFLDDVAAFQTTLFSSEKVKQLAKALEQGGPLPATDPPLNDLEQRGKALFEHHCIGCHGGPTQTVPIPGFVPAVHDIHISKPPQPPFPADMESLLTPSPLQPRQWAFRVPGQTEPVIVSSTDPGQALLTGRLDQLNFFDIPPLYGISKTAPYFHDNSAPTLEKVLRHYQIEFDAVRQVIPDFVPWPFRPDRITDEQFAPLIAYLKKI